MCGRVRALSRAKSSSPRNGAARMLAVIPHRGADDEGFHASGGVAFGFRRLSILDLSPAGHQPMSAADGKVTIIFNGEIYNYVELRRELESLGHRFHSTGDTEVLLLAYLGWGSRCFTRLTGRWGFMIS